MTCAIHSWRRINGVLLVLAGAVYDDDAPVPGALDGIRALRDAGLPLRLVSNTTRSGKRALLDRLRRMGPYVTQDELFTPAAAAIDWLTGHDCSAHLLVHADIEPELRDLPVGGRRRAAAIGDAGPRSTY